MAFGITSQMDIAHTALSLCGLLVLYLVSVVIYRIYFHPLARFRGPFFAKFTDFYTWSAVAKQNRTIMQNEMLQIYGSPVRISTNELVFSDLKTWADIYGQSSNPCLKDPGVYKIFSATGATNILNVIDRGEHARLRRLLSNSFSLKGILQSEALISDKIEEYVNLVFAPAAQEEHAVDIYEKTQEHYLDIVSYFSFGKSFNCLQGGAEITRHTVDQFMTVVPITSFFPMIRYFPIPALQEGYRGLKKLIDFSRLTVEQFAEKVQKEDTTYAKGSFLRNLVDATDPETGSKLSLDELVENCIIFLVAGSDTTAVTTIYAIWECGRRPHVSQKLLDEIRTAFPDPHVRPTYEQASKLPYLNAVIQETLRLWGPLNIGNPRVSPGRVLGEHFVPKGTVVSTLPYAAARNPQIFPNPEVFDPERWLNATADMKTMSRPFSYGPRNCIGMHLAEVVLTMTLARVFQLFDVKIDPSMTEEMMRLRDRGAMEPWGAKLLVKVTRAD